MQSSGIVKGTKNLADAKAFLDWAISEEAMDFLGATSSVVAMPSKNKPRKFFPPEVVERMIDNDFTKMAESKARIIKKWRERYDMKSEPKKK